jgi:hypothetical protein
LCGCAKQPTICDYLFGPGAIAGPFVISGTQNWAGISTKTDTKHPVLGGEIARDGVEIQLTNSAGIIDGRPRTTRSTNASEIVASSSQILPRAIMSAQRP